MFPLATSCKSLHKHSEPLDSCTYENFTKLPCAARSSNLCLTVVETLYACLCGIFRMLCLWKGLIVMGPQRIFFTFFYQNSICLLFLFLSCCWNELNHDNGDNNLIWSIFNFLLFDWELPKAVLLKSYQMFYNNYCYDPAQPGKGEITLKPGGNRL